MSKTTKSDEDKYCVDCSLDDFLSVLFGEEQKDEESLDECCGKDIVHLEYNTKFPQEIKFTMELE